MNKTTLKCIQDDNVNLLSTAINRNSVNNIFTVNHKETSLLHYSVKYNAINCLQFLLENTQLNVDLTISTGETPLHIACASNNIQVVNLLLKHNANINATYTVKNNLSEQFTPLKLAVIHGCLHIVDVLIAKKCNLHAQDNQKWTALHYAISRGQASICESLLKAGANVNRKDKYGITPLILACLHNKIAVMHSLIKHQANINLTCNRNWTPLHYACHIKNIAAIKLLVSNNARIDIINHRGESALNIAKNQCTAQEYINLQHIINKTQLNQCNYKTSLKKLNTV